MRCRTNTTLSLIHISEPVEEVPEPEPEKKDSPLLSLLLIGAVGLAGGGIGYYFKIYKPKRCV